MIPVQPEQSKIRAAYKRVAIEAGMGTYGRRTFRMQRSEMTGMLRRPSGDTALTIIPHAPESTQRGNHRPRNGAHHSVLLYPRCNAQPAMRQRHVVARYIEPLEAIAFRR